MISGSLQFTLGLQANQFLNALGLSSGKLLGFTSAAAAVQTAFTKMWSAVQQGGQLRDLAAGAGVSVKSLYQLQEAFQQVGASADRVPPMLLRMQRALGTDEGRNVLSSMGLDPESLGRLEAADQFDQIAAALGRLNVNAQSSIAFKLFGREGAMTFRQIAASGNDFSDALRRASGDANVWQKVAFQFDAIGDKLTEIQGRLRTMWALLAGSMIQAFAEGSLSELITDLIVTGVQAALDVLPAMFLKLGEILLRALEPLFIGIQAGMEYALDKGLEAVSNNPVLKGIAAALPGGAAAALLPAGWKADAFSEIYARRKAEGVRFNFGTGEYGLQDISHEANALLAAALQTAGGRLGSLKERLLELIGRLPQGEGRRAPAEAEAPAGVGGKGIGDRSAWERMGFILNGRFAGAATEPMRGIEQNTRASVRELQHINRRLAQAPPGAFLNI